MTKILLTGGSGKLGTAIQNCGKFEGIIAPPHGTKEFFHPNDLDITSELEIKSTLDRYNPDIIIHTAALVKMARNEEEPLLAMDTNIQGTLNLVRAVKETELNSGKKIRFIYTSTDGVYQGTRGFYSETDQTIPYNKYGWSKLAAECVVRLLPNYCIIRKSFFDPNNIPFDTAATDKFSSRVEIDYIVKAIKFLADSDFVGVINVGRTTISDYGLYRLYKDIKPVDFESVQKNSPVKLAQNASLDCSLWREMTKNNYEFR